MGRHIDVMGSSIVRRCYRTGCALEKYLDAWSWPLQRASFMSIRPLNRASNHWPINWLTTIFSPSMGPPLIITNPLFSELKMFDFTEDTCLTSQKTRVWLNRSHVLAVAIFFIYNTVIWPSLGKWQSHFFM